MNNILSNATKFSDKNGRVTFRTKLVEALPTSLPSDVVVVRFEVEDEGLGIDQSDLKGARLFSPYVQTEIGRTQGGKGTGLGLSLVRPLPPSSAFLSAEPRTIRSATSSAYRMVASASFRRKAPAHASGGKCLFACPAHPPRPPAALVPPPTFNTQPGPLAPLRPYREGTRRPRPRATPTARSAPRLQARPCLRPRKHISSRLWP